MRRKVFWAAGILLPVLIVAGCVFFMTNGLRACGHRENIVLPPGMKDVVITPGPEIREIEPGLSAVLYDGGYGFDAFLEQGGVGSDRALLAFIMKNVVTDASGLNFESSTFGCSTIAVTGPDGSPLFGRNFDWKKCDCLVVVSHPDKGYKSVSTVNLDFIRKAGSSAIGLLPDHVLAKVALYAPLDGMNEKGLCVAVNMIEDSDSIEQNTAKPDLTTTTAIRLLLNMAADVSEAIELLKAYDFHASFGYMVHFALADASGESAAVEYVHNKMNVVKSPILTNFYLADGDKKGVGSAQSHRRYEILENLLGQVKRMDEDGVKDALSKVSKSNFATFLSTEWSIVFNQKDLTARYYHREDFDRSYSFAVR